MDPVLIRLLDLPIEGPPTMPNLPVVSLEPVNRANFRACVDLKVRQDQDTFVAPNVFSIAHAKVEPGWFPLAIKVGDEVVGFAMYGQEIESGRWWIIRMMIGAAHQGRGFGHAAMAALIARMAERDGATEIRLGCVAGNDRARRLYERHGFRDTGEVDDNEAVMLLDLA